MQLYIRVAEAMTGAKVINFVFRHVCFVSRIWRQNSSPGSLAFSCFGNRAEISHMNPRRNSSRQPSEPARSTAGSCEETLKWLILPAGNAGKIAYSTQN